MNIQSVIIPKKNYTQKQAKDWIKSEGFKVSFYGKGVDIAKNFYRFRQRSPLKFIKSSYRTKKIGKKGIKIIVGKMKKKKCKKKSCSI